MTAPVFVDTNVLIYAVDTAEPKKQAAAAEWREALWRSRLGRISFQVLQEFYANSIRKWPKAREEARAEVKDLLEWKPVSTDALILERGWKLQERYQLSFWDSLIVASAKSTGCRYLLTEDFQAGQEFDGVRVVSPFLSAPSSLPDR